MTSRPKMLVLDDCEGRIEASPGGERLRRSADVRFLGRPLDEVPDEELKDIRVLFAIRERTRLDTETLRRFPDLKLLLQSGGHAYHLDAETARTRGIVTALGRRGVAARAAVPELTFALMIAAMRDLQGAQRAMAEGGWPPLMGRCLANRRLGILGMGRHGVRVAAIAEAFGMEPVAWKRPGAAAPRDGSPIPRLELEELLRTSDVVSVHLRLSEESRGLLDGDRLRTCKPGAVLVNTARGAIVDEDALVAVLRDGPLGAAGLDVFVHEPLAPDSRLRALPNVVLTPHIGWTVEEVFDEFSAIAADQLEGYLAGELPLADLLDSSAAAVDRPRCGGVAPERP